MAGLKAKDRKYYTVQLKGDPTKGQSINVCPIPSAAQTAEAQAAQAAALQIKVPTKILTEK